MTNPFTVSNETCRWYARCDRNVPMSFHKRGIYLCREHALLCWDMIEIELGESRMTLETIHEIDQARQQRRDQRYREFEEETQRLHELHEQRIQIRRAESSSRNPDKNGYIYYLKVGRHIKIGFAQNLERRLASYPPDTELLAVERGTLKLESQRHREYAHACAAGREWYDPNPALDDHIEQLAATEKHKQWDDSEWKRKTRRTKVKSKLGPLANVVW